MTIGLDLQAAAAERAAEKRSSVLPSDAAERKRVPVFSGVLAYFPRALCEVAKISREGNEQHHAGAPLHWDKSKSKDHLDALARHLIDSLDGEHDSIHALAQVAWRALAELETRLEQLPISGMDQPNMGIRDTGDSTHELKSSNSTAGFTQPPNCSPGVSEPTPPMHAVALEMAEAATCRKRHQPALDMDVNETVFQLPDNSVYELRPVSTCDIGGGLGPGLGPSARPSDPLNFDAPEYQTLVGN